MEKNRNRVKEFLSPGSLAMAKLFYPETKKTKTAFSDLDEMDTKSPYNNVVSKELQEYIVALTTI